MSGISLNIDVSDSGSRVVQRILALLTNRTEMNEAISKKAQALTREHLRSISLTHRNKLGAPSSGHWGKAVDKTTAQFDATSATVTIAHEGIGRSMHDVDIYPGAGKKAITIPLIAQAYNLRAAAIWESEGLVIAGSKNAKGKSVAVAGKRLEGGGFQAWYLLVPHVHQKQDRTLLPSDEEYTQNAKEAALSYVGLILSRS